MGTNYKEVTATGLVYSGAVEVTAIKLSGGTDASAVILTDATNAVSGAPFAKLSAVATGSDSLILTKPIEIKTGIYVTTLTGTAPKVYIYSNGYFSSTSTSTTTSTTSTSTSTTSTSTTTTSSSTSTTSTSITTTSSSTSTSTLAPDEQP